MDHKQTNVMVSTKNKTKSFPKNKFNLMGKTIPGVAMIQVSANAQWNSAIHKTPSTEFNYPGST